MSDRNALNGFAVSALVLSLLTAIGLVAGCTGAWRLQLAGAASPELSPSLLLGIGVALGFAAATSLLRLVWGDPGGSGTILVYVACASGAAGLAARLDGRPFLTALLVVLLGLGGFIALVHAIRLIDRGDAVGAENHWGGLGNGLGGSRLTPASSLILLAITFCVAAATLGTLSAASSTDAAGSAASATDASASRQGKPPVSAPLATGR